MVASKYCLRRGIIMFLLGAGFVIGALVVLSALPHPAPASLLGVATTIVGLTCLAKLPYHLISQNRHQGGHA